MTLVDTSIWVDFIRKGPVDRAAGLDDALLGDDVFTCGPVVAELASGASRPGWARLKPALDALRWAPIDHLGWTRVGLATQALRSAGATVHLADVCIAVAAAQAGVAVWTADRDFERIAGALGGLELKLVS